MIDKYGREIDYLRISLTDRCNLRCIYCMPEEGVKSLSHAEILTYDEILRICRCAADLGIRKIKLTGGEPLVRKGCASLAKQIKAIPGIEKVTLTTNGILLAEQLDALLDAGIDAINISLDTLDPELFKKVARRDGLEKVFEINRSFRNEGTDTRHNPEFTMCEFYWAYATFRDLMDFTEQLFAHIALEVCGGTVITYQGQEINLTPGCWRRLTFHDSLEEVGGHKPEFYNNASALRDYLKARGEKEVDNEGLGKLQAKLFDLDVEPKLIQPTFIYFYPAEISPLARRNDDNPELTDRFELFICGGEMANAFSELNDPVDQRCRFEDQMAAKAAGDEEANPLDEDYLRALEYGMPPTAGQGVGIDRLVMLLTDSPSIREVLFFPLLRPEV